MPALVAIPSNWSEFSSIPNDLDWEALGTLGRSSPDSYHRELSLLLQLVERWSIESNTIEAGAVLLRALDGWDSGGLGADGPGRAFRNGANRPLARLPTPGEGAWDRLGAVEGWALPAAALVARGLNPFEPNSQGKTAFARALQLGSAALVDQMLRLPHAPAFDAWPLVPATVPGYPQRPTLPLHAAAIDGNVPLLNVLLAAGAPVDQRDALGRTALMMCANTRVSVKALLAAGANPMAEDAAGLVALECWAVLGALPNAGLRDDWVKAACAANPKVLSRIKLAALFVNTAAVMRRLEKTELQSHRDFQPDAWGVLGAFLRHDQSRPMKAMEHLGATEWSPLGQALMSILKPATRTDADRALLHAHLPEIMDRWEANGWPPGRRVRILVQLLHDTRLETLAWPHLTNTLQEVIGRDFGSSNHSNIFVWTNTLENEERLMVDEIFSAIRSFANNAPGGLAQRALFLMALANNGWWGMPGGCKPRLNEIPHDELEKIRPMIRVAKDALKNPQYNPNCRAWLENALAQMTALDLDMAVENRTRPAPSDRRLRM